jgi:hypothetical protein
MNTIDIAIAEETYQNEWLLFEVTQTDEMNQPVKGKLILHSPDRDTVEQKAIELRDAIQLSQTILSCATLFRESWVSVDCLA